MKNPMTAVNEAITCLAEMIVKQAKDGSVNPDLVKVTAELVTANKEFLNY